MSIYSNTLSEENKVDVPAHVTRLRQLWHVTPKTVHQDYQRVILSGNQNAVTGKIQYRRLLILSSEGSACMICNKQSQ